jgi:hypothetical protein
VLKVKHQESAAFAFKAEVEVYLRSLHGMQYLLLSLALPSSITTPQEQQQIPSFFNSFSE